MITALFLGGVHRRSSRYAPVFGAAAVGLGGVLVPGSLSHDLLTPGVVVAITDSLILAGLVMTLAGRGRTRIAGAVLAALTGLLLIVFNSGFAAPWETFTIFALMFTGTMLYRAEAGQYPWRRALYVTVLVFGLTLVAVQCHVSPLAENDLAIRKTFNTLELAGLTFAVAMLCRHKKVPHALAWLGLISYSLYLLHPGTQAAPGPSGGETARRQVRPGHRRESARRNAMKPWFQCVRTHWNPGFTASGTTVISLGRLCYREARQCRFADVPSAF
jgi:hypothetical protein